MRRRAPSLIAAAVAAVAVAAVLHGSGALERLEAQAVDARFAIRGDQGPPQDVVVVGVDERTLAETNRRWPFPRAAQARLIDRLRAASPRLIAYDLQITERGESDAADVAFFDAVSRARPVLLATAETDGRGGTRVLGGDDNVRAAGAAVGSALFPVDDDGVVREVGGEADGLVTFANRAVELVTGERPLRPGERTWLDWRGERGTVTTLSWSRVARGDVPARELRDRVVVVGLTAPRLQDVRATGAGGPPMAGPEIQATAIDTLLRGAPLRSASDATDWALVALLALLVPGLAVVAGPRAMLAAPVAAAALAFGAQLAFDGGTVVAVAAPAVALLLGIAAAGAALLAGEARQRRRVRAAFGRFVPQEVVDDVLERADPSEGLPGEELDATVVFCDLRGFTTFAERRPAREVLALLNRYLAEMGDAVAAHGGTVVAYLGDGMMSVFGAPTAAPDHADRALAASREMAGERLARVNAGAAEPFRLGVGIHSGPVLSGTIGSARRMEYAAVGDTTNVAARVQALTKEHGVAILLTGAAVERLSATDGLRPIGRAPVRGRATPLELWTPEPQPGATPREPARARPRASSSDTRR